MLKEIVELLNISLPESKAEFLEAKQGDSSIEVAPDSIKKVCEFLKSHEKYCFNSLEVISGVDYTDYLEVSYFLNHIDIENPRQLQVKTKLTDRQNPRLESISHLWLGADWQERECFDMIGVRFDGHGDLRRILCPDDWIGFPLRKDYMAPKVYQGMEVFPEEKMNTPDRAYKIVEKIREKEKAAALKAAKAQSEDK